MVLVTPRQLRLASEPIKIALILHSFETGGIERCVARLVNSLSETRFDSTIICLSHSGSGARWVSKSGVRIIELNKSSRNDWQVVRRLAGGLREIQADIAVSHNWGTLLETSIARRMARIPVHLHAERGTVLGQGQPKRFRRLLRGKAMRFALNRASGVMANSFAVARKVEDACGFPANKITIIPNGVKSPLNETLHRRELVRKRLEISDEDLLFGSVGRLVPVKAFHDFVQAIASTNDRRIHGVILGSGSEERRLQQQIQELGIGDRMKLIGHQDNPGEYYSAMDGFVNCSISEGMSQAVVEAISFGLPCVVSDVGDSSVTVGEPNECGIVVSASDPSGLARTMERLANDGEARKRYSKNARVKYRTEYTEEGMIERFGQLFSRLVESA